MGGFGTRAGGVLAAGFTVGALGCGAATVAANAGDAGDEAQADLGAAAVDVTVLEASVADGGLRDVALETRGCPMIGDDVPTADLPTSDAPYVTQLASAVVTQCARMSDGTVRCQGANSWGRLGLGTFGHEYVATPTTVPGLRDVEQVMTGQRGATCTRHRDGTVRCWGSNRDDGLGTGHVDDQDCDGTPCRMSPTLVPGLADVVQLVDGVGTICAVRRNGSVWCWGLAGGLRPGGSSVPIATRLTDVVALWPRLYGWVWRQRSGAYGSDTPVDGLDIPADATFADGNWGGHLCYRLPNSSVRCLGFNAEGQVGNGRSSRDLPGVVEPVDPGLCGVRSIATGMSSTCAVLADRSVSCWGYAEHGGIGSPPTERCVGLADPVACATRPTPVPGLGGVDRLYLGYGGGCALRVDRSVWCWGYLAPGPDGALARVVW